MQLLEKSKDNQKERFGKFGRIWKSFEYLKDFENLMGISTKELRNEFL